LTSQPVSLQYPNTLSSNRTPQPQRQPGVTPPLHSPICSKFGIPQIADVSQAGAHLALPISGNIKKEPITINMKIPILKP
jgi:hypothetical protein